MKIITITNGAFALNFADVLSFGANEIFEENSRITYENLLRMIELDFAKEYIDDEVDENKEENVDTTGLDDSFENITDKDDLVVHAKEFYNVDLDKRKSLSNMISDLKELISKSEITE